MAVKTQARKGAAQTYSVRSQSAAHDALRDIEALQAQRDEAYEQYVKPLDDKITEIDGALKKWTLSKFMPGDGYEDDGYKLTVVQSHKRWWDGEKLQKLMPKGLFLQVVDYIPNSDKIDALVRAGKVDRKTIEAAYVEEPNTPYIKKTAKSGKVNGDAEAAALADKFK